MDPHKQDEYIVLMNKINMGASGAASLKRRPSLTKGCECSSLHVVLVLMTLAVLVCIGIFLLNDYKSYRSAGILPAYSVDFLPTSLAGPDADSLTPPLVITIKNPNPVLAYRCRVGKVDAYYSGTRLVATAFLDEVDVGVNETETVGLAEYMDYGAGGGGGEGDDGEVEFEVGFGMTCTGYDSFARSQDTFRASCPVKVSKSPEGDWKRAATPCKLLQVTVSVYNSRAS